MPRERDDNERESIWSVPKSTKTAYFALFFIHLVAGIALLIWRGDRVHETLADHVLYIWLNSGSIVLGSAGAALFYTDIGRYLLVLSRSLEEKLERTRERRREGALPHALPRGVVPVFFPAFLPGLLTRPLETSRSGRREP